MITELRHVAFSDICTAHKPTGVIGSKITNTIGFFNVLQRAIEAHDFSMDRIPGQAFIVLPEAIPFVSSGVGKPTQNPADYVLREYRGRVSAYLRREHACAVESCAVVVYTREAYLADPDVTPGEYSRISILSLVSHVLVAVLASGSGQSQLTPHRLVANLAGGNREAQVWFDYEIRAKARASIEYDNNWVTVAD